ncbi:hypothetical protein DXG01_003401, partial [Tephrocybe rancida]
SPQTYPLTKRPRYPWHIARKPLIVLGGAASVGRFAIQLGKLSGFSPIITTALLKHTSFLQFLGATHVLDRHLDTNALITEVAKITLNPVEVVFDTVSLPDTQAMGYSLLAPGRRLILLLPLEIKVKEEGKNMFHVTGMWTYLYSDTQGLGAQFYCILSRLIEAGDIKPNRLEVVPGGLNSIVSGLKKLELDRVSGAKLVIHPQETA